MAHHHGMRKKTRSKLCKKLRARGRSPVSRAIQDFEIGSKVHIKIDPSMHKGMPHPRFHGKTAEVMGKRGRAFVLSVNDGRANKTVICLPEHLARQEIPRQTNPKLIKLYNDVLPTMKGQDNKLEITKLLEAIILNR